MSSIWHTLKSALGAGGASGRVTRRRAKPYANEYQSTSRYRCCTIEPGPGACEAVTRLQEKRILQVDAPMLPLQECGRLQCDCRYRRHQDRREPEPDRRSLGAISTHTYSLKAKERRYAFGRRNGDDCTTDDLVLR